MGLFDKLQSRLELYRLEQKYTRRKNRPAFNTGAQYVDGEYVYADADSSLASPTGLTTTKSSHRTWSPPRGG